MSGIFGFFSTHAPQSLESSSVLGSLSHRGPDDQGWLSVGRAY